MVHACSHVSCVMLQIERVCINRMERGVATLGEQTDEIQTERRNTLSDFRMADRVTLPQRLQNHAVRNHTLVLK